MPADISEVDDLITFIIGENVEKMTQYRLSVSKFYNTHYFSIREWYVDFEGNYSPSNNGLTIPYTLHTSSAFYNALTALLSNAETLEQVRNTDNGYLIKQAEVYHLVSQELGTNLSDKLEVISVDRETRQITLGVVNERLNEESQ